jgi:hypothetical protein
MVTSCGDIRTREEIDVDVAHAALADVASYCGLSARDYVDKLPVLKGKIWPKIQRKARPKRL